jgi:hypothetical protein
LPDEKQWIASVTKAGSAEMFSLPGADALRNNAL